MTTTRFPDYDYVPIDDITDSLAYSYDPTDDLIAAIDAHREEERMAKKKPTMPKVSILDATPERLAHANDNHRIGDDGARRIEDSPLDRMHKRGLLDENRATNNAMHAAGARYYSDWYHSGLLGVQAMNPEAVGGGSGDPAHMTPASGRAAEKRQLWRQARAAVSPKCVAVLDAVVLEEIGIETAGKAATRFKSGKQAAAVASDRLATALYELAVHYSIIRRQAA